MLRLLLLLGLLVLSDLVMFILFAFLVMYICFTYIARDAGYFDAVVVVII